jgi:hypothetical protein
MVAMVGLPSGTSIAVAGTTVQLTGRVWDDADRDGRQGVGERGLPGVTIQLLTSPDNGLVQQVTTDSDGLYDIATTATGNHKLRIPLGPYVQLANRDIGDDAIDSDFERWGDTPTFYLEGVNLDLDAGMWLDALRGTVFFDRDGDIRVDEGEAGLKGVTVELIKAIDTSVVIATDKTDKLGRYQLVIPGAYADNSLRVRVVMPEDMARNPTVEPDNPNHLDASNMSRIHVRGVTRDFRFGLIMPIRLGDRVWNDRDMDGRQDRGEPGVPDVLVSLIRASDGVALRTVTTDAAGFFRVVAPSPGRYILWVRSPSGKYAPMRTDLPEGIDSDVRGKGRNAGVSPEFILKRDGHRRDFDAGVKVP